MRDVDVVQVLAKAVRIGQSRGPMRKLLKVRRRQAAASLAVSLLPEVSCLGTVRGGMP